MNGRANLGPGRGPRRGCRHGPAAAAPGSLRRHPVRADRGRPRRWADGRARSAAHRPSRPAPDRCPPPAAAIDRAQGADEQRQAAGKQSGGRRVPSRGAGLGLRGIGVMFRGDRQSAILQAPGRSSSPRPASRSRPERRTRGPSAPRSRDVRDRRDGRPPRACRPVIGADRIDRQRRAQLALQRHDRAVELGQRGEEARHRPRATARPEWNRRAGC